MHERELPQVGETVANSARRQDVLAVNSMVVGTLCLPIRSHAGPAADPQDPVVTRALLYLEEDAYPRVCLDVASRQGLLGGAQPDAAALVDKVERIDARSPGAGQGRDTSDHGPPHDIEHRWIVNVHLSPLGSFHNPMRPS